MNKNNFTIFKRYIPNIDTLKYILKIYIPFVAILYLLQGYLIFAPYASAVPQLEQSPLKNEAQPFKTIDKDGLSTTSWIIPPPHLSSPIIIFFHGNAIHALHGYARALYFLQSGYGYVLAEYPGYGGNEGAPSEKNFYSSARGLIKSILEKYPDHKIILYGESIGTGVAVQMATEFDIDALVLEAPYSSVTDVAKRKYFYVPVGLLLRHRFESAEKINRIDTPLLIIHGEEDHIIPLKYGKKLFEAASQPKTLNILKGAGHNDLLQHSSPIIAHEFMTQTLMKN